MKVVFLGSNPSALNDDPNVAFKGSASYPRLLKWIEFFKLNIDDVVLLNCSNRVLEKGEKLSDEDIDLSMLKYIVQEDTKIVALGQIAAKAVEKLKLDFFVLPHPSPLNRMLNDEKALMVLLNQCRFWIHKDGSFNSITKTYLKAL
jgi:uracil-DNA glycosylase